MKCNGKFFNLFAILVIGMFLIGFTSTGINNAVDPKKAQFVPNCESLRNHHSNIGVECIPSITEQTSNPMEKIFQIIFILFFISPPLIVILLFLIWRELKTRNKLR